MAIRVLLADDHRIFRESLAHLLAQERGIEVVAQAEDGATAARLAMELSPDVIITDIGMPGLNGIEATRRICEQHPQSRVIALSMHSDAKYITEMLKAGASGYLLKDSAPEELIEAIHTVAGKGTYLPPALAHVVVEKCVRHPQPQSAGAFAVLTSREREVLQLLTEGKTAKQIAVHFHVSVKTIETHRLHIMDKLHIHSIAELTKYAIREGLTSLDK